MTTKRSKIGNIEVIDGGDRATKVVAERDKGHVLKTEKTAQKKKSYETENILRTKHDTSFKNGEVKRSFSMGVSFDKDGNVIRDQGGK